MKFYSFCFYLFLLLNFSPSFQQSECESVSNPTGVSSCQGKTTSSNSEVCCYNKYKDYDGDGTECIEIKSEDATNEKLETTLLYIAYGNYWEDYLRFYDSLNVDCGNGTVFVNRDNECQEEFPDDYSDCKGKSTLSNNYTCCFGYNDDEVSCINILKEDAEDEDKLKAAAEKIKKGEYWEGYGPEYDFKIDCSSGFLKGIFVALFTVFFL